MAHRLPYVSIKPFLPHALVATVGVVLVPALATFAYAASRPDPSLLVLIGVGLLLTAVATGLGVLWWSRRPESSDISFGELILWSWLRRKLAEDRLEAGVGALGIDVGNGARPKTLLEPVVQVEILRDLAKALEVKDPYTHGHSRRVERHVRRTAAALGLSDNEIEEVARAAALHDVGKLRVPDRMLRKPDSLTIDERVAVQEHSAVGAQLVAAAGGRVLARAIRHHHERWDGMGYPDGLMGRQIPLFARIIAVADAYDAMVSTRPYRASLGHQSAVQVLRDESGAQFDPDVVEAFVETVPARIPAAAFMPFLVFPARLARKIAVPAKRVAATNLSPGVAAVAAAVVVGGALAPASPPVEKPASAAPSVQQDAVETDDDDVDATRAVRRSPNKKGSKAERRPARAATRSTPTADATVVAAPDAGASDVADEPPKTAAPKPAPNPDPIPEPDPAPAVRAGKDPQPTKGRDCSNPNQGGGKGQVIHCGD